MRIGSGFDVHRFGPGDRVRLGGVTIPHTQGLVAHSDGDVLLHAATNRRRTDSSERRANDVLAMLPPQSGRTGTAHRTPSGRGPGRDSPSRRGSGEKDTGR